MVICKTHGPFYVKPNAHTKSKSGCAKCGHEQRASNNRKSTQEFIKQAKQIHGDLYDYSDVIYVRPHDKVKIICADHGAFEQPPVAHLTGKHGCPRCGTNARADSTRKTTNTFIEQAHAIHNGAYLYNNAEYKSNHEKVTITCTTHGEFEQRPARHLTGDGCPSCVGITMNSILSQTEQFIDKASQVHNSKYDYTKVNYSGGQSKVTIICPTHGEFCQRPSVHMFGNGCPSCGVTISAGEQELTDYITSLDVVTEQSNRTLIPPYELDVMLPDHNIAIEYCGLRWHSEQLGRDRHYHKRKMDLCAKQNIQILTIYEYEWQQRQEQVKRKIAHMLNKSTEPTIYARKCSIIALSGSQKRKFFDDNHIQGDGPGSITVGLMYNNVIVAAMCFIKQKTQHYLNRYATSCKVPGGFSKLLKHFQQTYNWTTLTSFADLRWSTGQLYKTTSWTLDCIIPPDYSYSADGRSRSHKFNYRRKNLPRLLTDFNPSLSERENCDNNGIYRIWDCGKLRYVIHNSFSG
jgi:hypothetical protein